MLAAMIPRERIRNENSSLLLYAVHEITTTIMLMKHPVIARLARDNEARSTPSRLEIQIKPIATRIKSMFMEKAKASSDAVVVVDLQEERYPPSRGGGLASGKASAIHRINTVNSTQMHEEAIKISILDFCHSWEL
mmetsp:Transcript_10482/g.25596  ORF Transcript_10482/g.25596 Transcript_10482/m.25596 type:complete len:136 (-) Transcript_10482:313-720(-)